MRSRRVNTSWIWKNQPVKVSAFMFPPDHSAGILTPQLEEISIFDESGKEVDITGDEHDQLCWNEELRIKLDDAYYGESS